MASKTSILIVDDSRTVRVQLEGLLAQVDDVEIVGQARNGAEAIRLAAQHEPDLILMDIVMPGMDGLAALRVISANLPDTKVAMLSSVGGRPSLAQEAFRMGAVQVIGKPVERAQLVTLVEGLKLAGEDS